MTTVIHIKTAPPGWQQDPNYVYVGRDNHPKPSVWGNPFRTSRGMTRAESLASYRAFVEECFRDGHPHYNPKILSRLKGKILVCHCYPLACHGDILAEYVDEL